MQKKDKVSWGILGAARITERMLPAIVNASNSRLAAIASRRPGAARAALDAHAPGLSGVQVYEDFEPLLEDQDVQSVYLPLAQHEHAQWALKAIERGKHVLIEKPMALTVEEIDAIEAAATSHGVKAMEGFMYRFHPQYARVQDLVSSGAIGEVKYVRSSYGFVIRPERMYRLENAIEKGGGAMWDVGPYAVHSIRSWFGSTPHAVSAMMKRVDTGADSVVSAILDFGDGRYGQFNISFECARRNEYEITGTEGGVKCHTVWPYVGDVPIITWWVAGGFFHEERLPYSNHFVLEVEHFADCVLHDKPPLLTIADARENCRVICAVLQSAREGRIVELT